MAERSPEMLIDLFKTKGVVTFSDLQEALGSASRATTFRYLKRVKYLRSYNHNGRYYTHRDPALFDRFGLYSVGDVHFSRDRTLGDTLRRLVRESQAGWTQRDEIRAELLGQQGIVVSDGSISNLCDRFLRLLEGLHRRRAPLLCAAMNGGYPLHIDATSEHGKGGLFVCLDGWRGWVLHAVKISSENADELRPCLEETIRRFADPIAVVRDLSAAESAAVDSLRAKGIPDLVCHYHFLGAIGKKLFDDPYAVLRNLLRQSKVRTQLRDLLRELRQQVTAEVYEGKYGHGRLREDLLALLYWVLEGEGQKDLPYPFSLPHLGFYQPPRGDATSRAMAAITPLAGRATRSQAARQDPCPLR